MKIVFFGTPPFSAYILEKLHASINVVAVVCPPDREKGRGRKIISPSVKLKDGIRLMIKNELDKY